MADVIHDLHSMPENARCKLIGRLASEGKSVAVIVEDKEKKIKRYERKVKETFPEVKMERTGSLTKGTVVLKFTRAQN